MKDEGKSYGVIGKYLGISGTSVEMKFKREGMANEKRPPRDRTKAIELIRANPSMSDYKLAELSDYSVTFFLNQFFAHTFNFLQRILSMFFSFQLD